MPAFPKQQKKTGEGFALKTQSSLNPSLDVHVHTIA